MKVTVTKEDGLKRELKIVIPAKDMDSKVDAKLAELATTVKVPGFRPGKVPVEMVKQRYGDSVLGDVVQEAVSTGTQKALVDNKMRPAMQPNIELDKFEKGKDLEYTVAFEVIPDVKPMDIKKIKLEKLVTKADDKAVKDALGRITESNKATETIKEKRASKKGDVVLIDFDGKVDGERRDGMKGEGHELELGSNSFIPGFEEQLIGKKAGDKVAVTVTFPDPYMSQELAGKEAVFDCVVHEIKKQVTPKADDAFAEKLGLKDLKELKERIQEQIENEYESYSRSRLKRDLLDILADEHKFEVPESLVKAEFDAIWQQVQQEMEAAKMRGDDVDTSDEDEMKEEYQAIAERRVRLGLILSSIGSQTKIDIAQDDLNRALIAEAQKYPGHEQQVFEYYQKNPQAMEALKAPLFEEKVVDYIVENAQVKEKSVSLEELTKDPDEGRSLTKPKGKKAAAKKPAAKKKTAKKK